MASIDIETILTIIYVRVDDWYQTKGHLLLQGKPGAKPEFSDSEMITLMLAEDFIPYPGEQQFVGYIRANHLELFPQLLDQSQFNRRARSLRLLVEALRRDWLIELGIEHAEHFLIDTKPIPVVGYKRSKSRSDFAGSAAYGYCASRNMHYFGYKLVMVTTLDGKRKLSSKAVIVSRHLNESIRQSNIRQALSACSIVSVSVSKVCFTKSKTQDVILSACWLKPSLAWPHG